MKTLTRLITLLAVCALPLGATAAEQPRRKVIIDDENFALMHLMLLEAPDVQVLGITTVTGNVWVNRATAMVLRGLEIAGRTDVPVAAGAQYPLLNSEALTDRWEALYGKLTWKGAWMKQWVEPTQESTPPYFGPDDPVNLPGGNPVTKASGEIAANFLIRMVHQYPGEVTIIACGPLTNLALAQRLDPQFAKLAKGLVYMGGSLNPHQQLDNQSASEFAREYENTPRREFNERFDPEAASIVSRSPWNQITMVPVDPSTGTQLTAELLGRMSKAANPTMGKFIAAMEAGFPLWDESAAGAFLDPSIVTEKASLYIDYNTQFGASYGDTLSWSEGYQPALGERKATVVLKVDAAKLEALMVKLMGNSMAHAGR